MVIQWLFLYCLLCISCFSNVLLILMVVLLLLHFCTFMCAFYRCACLWLLVMSMLIMSMLIMSMLVIFNVSHVMLVMSMLIMSMLVMSMLVLQITFCAHCLFSRWFVTNLWRKQPKVNGNVNVARLPRLVMWDLASSRCIKMKSVRVAKL